MLEVGLAQAFAVQVQVLKEWQVPYQSPSCALSQNWQDRHLLPQASSAQLDLVQVLEK